MGAALEPSGEEGEQALSYPVAAMRVRWDELQGHLVHGIHRGFVRVRGPAPLGLTWELGARPGADTGPLAVR
jgi:hypothetical protein